MKEDEMHDSFEFRQDPDRAGVAVGCSVQLCPVKWQAEKTINAYVRKMAVTGDGEARKLADLLDQVGITQDFEPSPIRADESVAA
jgi:hypothetical protein